METRNFNVDQSDYVLTELGNVSFQSRTMHQLRTTSLYLKKIISHKTISVIKIE